MFYTLLILLLTAVPQNKEPLSTVQLNLVGMVQKGVSISDFKKEVTYGEFVKEPLSNYGIDSENFGWVHITEGRKDFFVWTKHDTDLIYEIIILDSSLSIDNITVGNTLDEFLSKNPNAIIALDVTNLDAEYVYSTEKNYIAEFLNEENKVAEYNDDYTLKSIKNRYAKIDRIRVKKSN